MSRPSTDFSRDRHSRRIRVLKMGLPLLALAILSSLFLFSRSITIEGVLPFAEVDIADRLREPKMTQVRIATTTEAGAVVDLRADSVAPQGAARAIARAAFGTITGKDGTITTLAAPNIDYDEGAATAALTGGVRITSAGYVMTTQALDVDISAAVVESQSSVQATGPLGQLDAGRMRLKQNPNGVLMVFKSGVRLIYTPVGDP